MAEGWFERMYSSVSWGVVSAGDGSRAFGRSTEERVGDVHGVDAGVLKGDRLKGSKLLEASLSRLALISWPKSTAVLTEAVGVLSQGENTVPDRVCRGFEYGYALTLLGTLTARMSGPKNL